MASTLAIIEEATYKQNDNIQISRSSVLNLTGLINLGGSMKLYTPPGSSNTSTHLMPASPLACQSEASVQVT